VLVGLDASSEILERARAGLPDDRVELRVARLEDPLPEGPFDVIVSALAVHHLDGPGKAELFRRSAAVLTPTGRLVVGDFVAVDDPADIVTKLDPQYDTPSSVVDQLSWLTEAGRAGPHGLGRPRPRRPGRPRKRRAGLARRDQRTSTFAAIRRGTRVDAR
jgi:tRNA (cmo5U34)-methyltransferase